MTERISESENIDTAPGPVSKKQTRPYPKRLFFIVLALVGISMFLILIGGSAISRKPSAESVRNTEAEPKYTGSEPTLNMVADTPPEMSPLDDMPDYALPADAGPSQNKEATQTKRVDTQWIDHQRMAYLSKSMVPGWPISSTTPEEAGGAGAGLQRMPSSPSGVQQNLLDLLLAQQGSGKTGASQRDFFDKSMSAPGNLASTRQPQRAPYKITAGTVIPCVMVTGINSDLPGNVIAQVSENVYDFVNPYVCLIPQGSRVFGEYSSNVDFGQKRVQVRWTSLTYPDGSTLDLKGMQGVDKAGYTGIHDKYHPHYSRMFTAAILTSILTVLPDLILGETNSSSASGTTIIVNTGDGNSNSKAAKEAASTIAEMGKKAFDKTLNVQPTIQIRPGTRINIQANADVLFNMAWK